MVYTGIKECAGFYKRIKGCTIFKSMYNCVHLLMHYYRQPPLIKELFLKVKNISLTKVKASYKQKIVGAFLSVINKLTSY